MVTNLAIITVLPMSQLTPQSSNISSLLTDKPRAGEVKETDGFLTKLHTRNSMQEKCEWYVLRQEGPETSGLG